MQVIELVEAGVARHPERVAYEYAGRQLSWRQVLETARGLATVIAGSGARHLVYVGAPGGAWPLWLFGSAAAAVPVAPVNFRLPAAQVLEQLARFGRPLVVADEAGEQILAEDHHETLQASSAIELADAHASRIRDVDPGHPVVLLFTSGTSGPPKVVKVTHGNLRANITSKCQLDGASESDAVLLTSPPYHIGGTVSALGAAFRGLRIVYLPRFEPGEWVRTASREKITEANMVPLILSRILDQIEDSPADLSSLRKITCGGAPLTPELAARASRILPAVDLINTYGSTETVGIIAETHSADRTSQMSSPPDGAVPGDDAFRVNPGIEIEIRAAGHRVPAGRTGEIFVRGEQVSGRYQGVEPAAPDGWFSTRDAGWLDQEGHLHVRGRVDDTIIRGGENVSPWEIESVLRQHPAVADVAAFGIPDEKWGQDIGAAIVLVSDDDTARQDLARWALERLRSSRTPKLVLYTDSLPYSAVGKLQREEIALEVVKSGLEWRRAGGTDHG